MRVYSTGIVQKELICGYVSILQVHSVHTHTHTVAHTYTYSGTHTVAHTHTHCDTHIPIPFEDCKPTGLKVDIATKPRTSSSLILSGGEKPRKEQHLKN